MTQLEQTKRKALLIGAFSSAEYREICEESLRELARLCESYRLEPKEALACPLKKIDPGVYLGKGKLEEIGMICAEGGIDVVVFDDEISPGQQKNLEALLNKPVIDRTELIIGVFAERAQTKEARLQVELAQVKYQFPRLRRMWTHLSRQSGTSGGAGGGAYLKGEGEKQIEIDRRLLKKRIEQLGKEIEEVRAHREIQRAQRKRSRIPVFAIVGYTNAGKSTLLNLLTEAKVLAEDRLFATLDTTTRKYVLPNRQEILLVDTVGFIRKIPHTLVAAFKSTLEEAIHTDVLLHLIDVSSPAAELQAEATSKVLSDLGASKIPMITIFNKMDACSDPKMVDRLRLQFTNTVAISAKTGEGIELLLQMMMKQLSGLRKTWSLRIPQSHYGLTAELMREGRVISCEYEGSDVLLRVEIPSFYEHKIEPFLAKEV